MSISSSRTAQVPPVKLGWLKKYSRTGMIKNWKSRYVVLEAGIITYFEKQLPQQISPYGENEKGDLSLKGATISLKRDQGTNRIFIECGDKQADILLEAESAADAASWCSAVNEHIIYANNNATQRKGPMYRPSITELPQSSSGKDDPVIGIGRGSDPERHDSSESAGSGDGYWIKPTPGFVIKTRRKTDGEKVFINVCEHYDIPTVSTAIGTLKSNTKWPLMVTSSQGREFRDDDKDGKSMLYDVVVHPSVLLMCSHDESLATRDLLCHRIIKLMRSKFDSNIDVEYKLPKVSKKFKGNIEQVFISLDTKRSDSSSSMLGLGGIFSSKKRGEEFRSSSVSDINGGSLDDGAASPSRPSSLSRSNNRRASTSVTGLKSQASISSDATDDTDPTSSYGSNSGATSKGVSFGGGGGLARTVSESMAASSKRSATATATSLLNPKETSLATNVMSRFRLGAAARALTSGTTMASGIGRFIAAVHQVMQQKKYVPYVVIKQGGVIMRPKPVKDGTTGKMAAQNDRIMVYARRTIAGINWLKCKDGWIQESLSPKGEKHIVPVAAINKQPLGAEVLSTRLVEVTPKQRKGWFYNGPPPESTFTMRFTIAIQCPDDIKFKIHRSYSEIIHLRGLLLKCGDRAIVERITKLSFPTSADGDFDLLCYTSFMAEFVETVSKWLHDVVKFVPLERCRVKEYKTFLTPNDEDVQALEVDLCADGGLGGAFAEDLNGGAGSPSAVAATEG